MKAFLIAILFACIASASIFAQTDESESTAELSVGMVDLRLGMQKDALLDKLSADYALRKLGDNQWAVQGKPASYGSIIYGSIGFKDGKLAHATKRWTQGDESKFTFAQAIYGALDEFMEEHRQACFLNTETSHSPIAERKVAHLTCGLKRINIEQIAILSGEAKGRYLDVEEELGSVENLK